MNYYELAEEQRFLGDDNPFNLGGLSTDTNQLYFTLVRRIAAYFGDCTPDILRYRLEMLNKKSLEVENLIQEIISESADFAGGGRLREPCGKVK